MLKKVLIFEEKARILDALEGQLGVNFNEEDWSIVKNSDLSSDVIEFTIVRTPRTQDKIARPTCKQEPKTRLYDTWCF